MWTISHFPSTFWRTAIILPSTVCRDPSGGRILRMKCPVQSAASSPSKSIRPCLGTRETLPGDRLRSPLKLPSTSDQPFIRRGSEVENLVVFSDCKNREASSSASAVRRACPNWPTLASTSALIVSEGDVVGGEGGSIVGVAEGIPVGISGGSGIGMAVAVGLAVGASAGTPGSAMVGWGAGVTSPPQAATSTARRARKTPGGAHLIKLAAWSDLDSTTDPHVTTILSRVMRLQSDTLTPGFFPNQTDFPDQTDFTKY